MNQLEKIFNFENNSITVQIIDGEPWFDAGIIARILGYSETTAFIRHLDPDETRSSLSSRQSGGLPSRLLSLGGLTHAFGMCRKPAAKPFQRWVNHVVLPAIFKTGKYEHTPTAREQIDAKPINEVFEPLYKVALLLGYKEGMASIKANSATKQITGTDLFKLLDHTVKEDHPTEVYFTPTELGKMIAPTITAREMNFILEEKGFQISEKGKWRPTEKGNGFALVQWVARKYSGGTSAQVKWRREVLDVL